MLVVLWTLARESHYVIGPRNVSIVTRRPSPHGWAAGHEANKGMTIHINYLSIFKCEHYNFDTSIVSKFLDMHVFL